MISHQKTSETSGAGVLKQYLGKMSRWGFEAVTLFRPKDSNPRIPVHTLFETTPSILLTCLGRRKNAGLFFKALYKALFIYPVRTYSCEKYNLFRTERTKFIRSSCEGDNCNIPFSNLTFSITHFSPYILFLGRTRFSVRKQPTFRNANTGFPVKWRLRNERRNRILMTRHYPGLVNGSDWSFCVGNFFNQSEALPR